MTREDTHLIRISQLKKRFADLEVLRGIDLEIRRKEVVCIIGKSGSGKSTLLRCINGLESFEEGSLQVGGQHVDSQQPAALRELRKKVGMVFQSFNLFPAMSVGDNIMLAPRMVHKTPAPQARQLAQRLLARVGLSEKFDSYPHELSGGQQQRVAIARALAMNPEIILCDEITSALDPELVQEVLQVVEGLAQDGVTIVMVTHEMEFARKVSDRIVFMHQGRVHEVGAPAQLFSQPSTPELGHFLSLTPAPAHP